MKCPGCDGFINDCAPHCESCGFDISEFDKVLQTPEERSGVLYDWAAVMSPDGCEKLRQGLDQFAANTGIDFCIVTLPTAEPRSPREFAFWLFNHWEIGGEDHLGVLVLLSVAERRIEVEVGYTMEKYISDDEASGVLEHHVVPFLKKGDFDNGLFYAMDVLARIFEHGRAEEKKNEQAS